MNASAIRGLVLDEQEWPIAGAAVTLAPLSPGLSVPDIATTTDDSGRYAWSDLEEGRYEVGVRAEGFHTAAHQTYAGAVVPARVDFHLTRTLPAHRRTSTRPVRTSDYEQVTSTELTGGDVVEGTD
ncbi:hypothetical protein GCM10020358_45320 [Amorphoplanes nipponensis]|uniref:Carboxypeptidase regulatory-like domain-containing protein n=1 Tax=Actinoplanes nipponensis TaxID=135950 RepID=A0A919JQJ4_9ACTN|nr:carboxypeptidase-like regulatory domain-containing protein [Actinoplanes nipponensis]GIE53592.1 hypothetical protein Ani05nite_71260 [Actinoplanes nipponensis]